MNRYLGLIWLFCDPLIKILLLWGLYEMTGRKPGYGMPIPLFMMTGFLPWILFISIVNRCGSAIESNKALLYYRQVTTLDLIVARAILEAASMTIVLIVMMSASVLAGFPPDMKNGLTVAVGFILVTLTGLGLGMIIAAWAIIFPALKHFVTHVLRILFFTSGVFYTVEHIPVTIRSEMLVNPILHQIDIIRGGFFKAYDPIYSSLSYAFCFPLILLALGLVSERLNRKRIIV